MSQSAHYLPVRFLLPRIKANYFCVNVWICKTLLYICYVNNDKQTHNDMTARYLYLYMTATDLSVDQAARSIELSQSQGHTLEQIAEAFNFANKL